jgi:hypothetical protein
MKYIMFVKQTTEDALPHFIPVIFPDELVHAHMAQVVLRTPEMRDFRPISAGFVNLEMTVMGRHFPITTHGESETLKMKARGEDARIIKFFEQGGRHGGPYLIPE